MTEYTIASVVAVGIVVAVELLWLRTGTFATATFWIAYGIIVFFQCLVDGWLTKLSAPIVIYNPDELSEWRFPFDIPVEDFLFGFALIALTIMLWERAGSRRDRDGEAAPTSGPAEARPSPPQ
ncbi:MAG TPA: lycopene cyclase domain-containing protein [Acidimicrobiales bacterium]|nr:lycopene cyclase domain-containing protein [Acidimicrobiales bacterium]